MPTLLETALDWSDAGYKVIPVNTESVPLVRNHFNHEERYTQRDIESYCAKYPTASLAVVCGYDDIVVIDVDVDRDVLARRLLLFIQNKYGRTGITIRKRSYSNRYAVICRADETLKAFGNGHSSIYVKEDGTRQVVEYLGYNKILTIEGSHRKQAGSRYYTDTIVPVQNLARISKDFLLSLFHYFDTYRSIEWTKLKGSSLMRKRREQELEKVKEEQQQKNWWETQHFAPKNPFDEVKVRRKPLTDKEREELLEGLDPCDREDWINVGMSFFNLYDGSIEGFNLWHEWGSQEVARQAGKYKGKFDHSNHWKSFHRKRQSDGEGYANMTFEVLKGRDEKKSKRGWTKIITTEDAPDPVNSPTRFSPKRLSGDAEYKYMLDNYVLIAEGDCVADLSKTVGESIRPVNHMRSFLKSKKMIIEEPNQNGKIVKKKVSMFEQWYEDPEHKTAWGIEYLPGEGRMIPAGRFKDRPNSVYYNKYCPPLVKRLKSKDKKSKKINLFYRHLSYLFPNEGAKWMMNWMAQLVQEPDRRYRVSPLSISLYEGTGRGWLSELLSKLVGINNYTTVRDILDIVRPGAKSGYLDGTTLLVVNEVFIKSRERFSLMSQLKTLLSDDLQEIDVKFGKHTYNQRVYTRFFFQSNHINGMVIDDGDTRIQPFICRSRPKSREYYEELYACLEDENFVNSVYDDLMAWEIDYDLLTYSQDTEDRRAVINASLSPTAHAFFEFRKIVGGRDFTDEMLEDYVGKHIRVSPTGEGGMVNPKELAYFKAILKANTVNIFGITLRNFDGLPKNRESKESLLSSLSQTKAILRDSLNNKIQRRKQHVDED